MITECLLVKMMQRVKFYSKIQNRTIKVGVSQGRGRCQFYLYAALD